MPCIEHEIPGGVVADDNSYVGRVIRHLARPTLTLKSMRIHSQIVAQKIEEGGFDVLFANTCFYYHAPLIGQYFGGPKLLYLQEPNRYLYEALPRLPWLGSAPGASWRSKIRSKFDQVALRTQANVELANATSFDRILVNSYFSREGVARAYGLESSVCYLGVDFSQFEPSTQPRQGFVLGVGAIAPTKRVDLAIKGIGAIQQNRPKLIWVGNFADELYKQSVDALAREYGVDVEWRVLVPDSELVQLMQTAGCVIYLPKLEPFGYVPLEAAASGASVVTVREGGLRETMSEIGYLADPNPESVAQQICRVLADPVAASDKAMANIPALHAQWGLAAATDRLEAHLLEITRRP